MNIAIRAGIVLAVSVSLLQVLLTSAGLHLRPVGPFIGILASIGLNIAVVYFALNKTAPKSVFVEQLLYSAVLGIVGGVLIFVLSWSMMTFVFPDMMDEVRAIRIEALQQREMTEELRQRFIESTESMSVTSQAFAGLIGTFFTSLIVGAIVAIFKRQ